MHCSRQAADTGLFSSHSNVQGASVRQIGLCWLEDSLVSSQLVPETTMVLISKQNRRKVYTHLFNEGVCADNYGMLQ